MPNQITHYYFAQEVYSKLKGKSKEIIDRYPNAFKAGAIGPDFMFVLRESSKEDYRRYANVMQYLSMYEVFAQTADYIRENPSDCLTSYMLGMLCHYVSDFRGHAYINFFVEEIMPKYYPAKYQTALHTLLETGIDEVIILEYIKAESTKFNVSKLIKPTREEKEQIANLYVNVINKIIGFDVPKKKIKKALKTSIFFLKVTTDKNGYKKRLADAIEDKLEIKKQLSSSIRPPYLFNEYDFMNRKHLKWRKVRNEDELTNESFDRMMEDCKGIALKYIRNYISYINDNKPLLREDYTINYEGVRVY